MYVYVVYVYSHFDLVFHRVQSVRSTRHILFFGGIWWCMYVYVVHVCVCGACILTYVLGGACICIWCVMMCIRNLILNGIVDIIIANTTSNICG